ncbi:MAG: hypothetical protein IKT26_08430 [Bacteroidaceae bacterium]|nr:hypothetical protein [Bacteroidaceae bacterium]
MQQNHKKKNVYALKTPINGIESEKICNKNSSLRLSKFSTRRIFFTRSTKKYIPSLAIFISCLAIYISCLAIFIARLGIYFMSTIDKFRKLVTIFAKQLFEYH